MSVCVAIFRLLSGQVFNNGVTAFPDYDSGLQVLLLLLPPPPPLSPRGPNDCISTQPALMSPH